MSDQVEPLHTQFLKNSCSNRCFTDKGLGNTSFPVGYPLEFGNAPHVFAACAEIPGGVHKNDPPAGRRCFINAVEIRLEAGTQTTHDHKRRSSFAPCTRRRNNIKIGLFRGAPELPEGPSRFNDRILPKRSIPILLFKILPFPHPSLLKQVVFVLLFSKFISKRLGFPPLFVLVTPVRQ